MFLSWKLEKEFPSLAWHGTMGNQGDHMGIAGTPMQKIHMSVSNFKQEVCDLIYYIQNIHKAFWEAFNTEWPQNPFAKIPYFILQKPRADSNQPFIYCDKGHTAVHSIVQHVWGMYLIWVLKHVQ